MWRRACGVALFALWMSCVLGHPGQYDVQDPGHYLNSFLVQVSSREVAEQVARDYGFELVEKLPLLDYYHFTHKDVVSRSKRSSEDYVNKLKEDSRVNYVEQQITLKRVKRTHQVIHDKQKEFPIRQMDNSKYMRVKSQFDSRGSVDVDFNDEYFGDEWYLVNKGQSGGTPGVDMNVARCWDNGFTGKGQTSVVLDDGLDHTHDDLKRNYDPNVSADFNDVDDKENDPTPSSTMGNDHGTRCAGEIAAEANNGVCGVGIAYDSKIGGVRILDGQITDILEAKALTHQCNKVDVFSASWGPRDDGETMEGLNSASIEALKTCCKKGRNGKGSVYVWASGNGGDNGDHCGADGYVASIYSLSIQSMSDKGKKPYFGEKCCSTMAAVTAGGEPTKEEEMKWRNKLKVVTTDINNGCIENFEGTSSAAPLATGCLLLVLQANPDLTWRDVQHIVAMYARVPGPDTLWIINGAGYHVNSQFGFGLMDCAAMVQGAQQWTNVPEQHTCQTQKQTVNSKVSPSSCHKETFHFDGCQGESDKSITHLEHVEVTIELTAPRRGDVEIFLTSPAGTRSHLLGRRRNDASTEGIDFKFMTVHNWMEDPNGEWTLEVCYNEGEVTDTRRNHNSQGNIYFKRWSMIAYGYHSDEKNIMKKSYMPTKEHLENISEEEMIRSRNVVLKRAESTETHKDETRTNTDITLDYVQRLLDSIGDTFGTLSQGKRVSKAKTSSKKYLFNHGNQYGYKRNMEDYGSIEDNIDEILSKMDERHARAGSLREVLIQTRDELQQELRQRRMNMLISELKQLLKDEEI